MDSCMMVTNKQNIIGIKEIQQWYLREFVILYRKVAMVMISVFGVTYGVKVQSLMVLAVSFMSYMMQIYGKPFQDDSLNDMEKRALVNSTITLYCGLYFISSKPFKSIIDFQRQFTNLG